MNKQSRRQSQDAAQDSAGSSRFWLWPLGALLLILFGIGIGLAITTFTDRTSTPPASVESDPTAAPVSATPVSATPVSAENAPVVTDASSGEAAGENSSSENNAAENESSESTSGEMAESDAENADAVSIDAAATETVTPIPPTEVPTTAPTALPTATETPLPDCALAVVAEFESLVDRSVLGCPSSEIFVTWAAWQPFERGYLFWRSDRDNSFALFGPEGGQWIQLELRGGTEPVDRGDPPAGLEAPVRGFGYVWATDDNLYNQMGWATDKEKGFCVAMQGFDNGLVLQSTPVDSCTPNGLFNQAQAADWKPVTIVSTTDGRWSVDKQLPPPDAVAQAPTAAPTTEPEQSTSEQSDTDEQETAPENQAAESDGSKDNRPAINGLFLATAAGDIELDGDLAEWGDDGWMDIGSVVWGEDERSDDADFSAQFQLRWSDSDLWFALRVQDDLYRSGPFGTDMWQGDGLELQFDRELVTDYDSGEMDGDDYQIGIGFGPTLSEITAYRWIPYELEGSMPIAGAAQATDQGYDAEFRLPWSTFTVTDERRRSGQAFGFNLSINDNDADTPEQQTTLSASPARTDHKTPTEWGTLVLE